MLAIFAILSDIPTYIAALISQITGTEMSSFVDFFNHGIADVINAIEQLLTRI